MTSLITLHLKQNVGARLCVQTACRRGDAVWDRDTAQEHRCGSTVRQLSWQGATTVPLPDPYNELSPLEPILAHRE